MKMTVHGEDRFIPVSTVTLLKQESEDTYPFHCINCGNTHAIIGGKVTKIYPILEPSDNVPAVSTCKSCKAKYTFQDTQEEPTYIVVLLAPKNYMQPFYCYLGGGDEKFINRILDYDTKTTYSYKENSVVEMPFTSACTNSSCNLTYEFNQFS